MSIWEQFSEKERAYHQYQARQNYLREQTSIQHDLEQMRQGMLAAQEAAQAAQARAEVERVEKEAALARIRELEAQLARKS